MLKKIVKVKAHKRHLKTGEVTSVRYHTRNISNKNNKSFFDGIKEMTEKHLGTIDDPINKRIMNKKERYDMISGDAWVNAVWFDPIKGELVVALDFPDYIQYNYNDDVYEKFYTRDDMLDWVKNGDGKEWAYESGSDCDIQIEDYLFRYLIEEEAEKWYGVYKYMQFDLNDPEIDLSGGADIILTFKIKSFDKHTNNQLRNMIKARGLKGYSNLRKSELVNLL